MSDQTPAIHQALSTALNSLAMPTEWENTAFVQPAGSYLRETFKPAPRVASALGTDAPNRVTGVYLIDIFTFAGNGWKDADDIFILIAAAYPRGATLTQGATQVRIVRCYRSGGLVEGDRYHVPVTVEFRADIPPS